MGRLGENWMYVLFAQLTVARQLANRGRPAAARGDHRTFAVAAYQNRCWVKRLHQVSSTRSTEPLAARPKRSCKLLRSA